MNEHTANVRGSIMHVDCLSMHVLPIAQNISCSSTGREPCMGPMQSLRAVSPQRWSPFRAQNSDAMDRQNIEGPAHSEHGPRAQ